MFLCLAILTVAAICDAYSGRIPRGVTVSGMIVSQIWVISQATLLDALISLIGAFVLMVLLFPLFMIGTIGAGDIKVIMILPAFMTISDSLLAVFMSFVAGACISLVMMIRSHSLIRRLRVLKAYIDTVIQAGIPVRYDTPASASDGRLGEHQIHFTIPILIGTAVCMGGLIPV